MFDVTEFKNGDEFSTLPESYQNPTKFWNAVKYAEILTRERARVNICVTV